MNADDASRITQIALMAAMADGQISPEEQRELASVANRLGVPAATTAIDQPVAARQGIGILAASLSDAEARRTAYEVALAVCTVDGAPTPPSRPSSARCTVRSGSLRRRPTSSRISSGRCPPRPSGRFRRLGP